MQRVVLWLPLLAGCPHDPDVLPDGSTTSVADLAGGEEVLLLEGFDLLWQQRPHRLRKLGFSALGRPGVQPLEGRVIAQARGGTWSDGTMASDTPLMTMRYAVLSGAEIRVHPGNTWLELIGRRGVEGGLQPATQTTSVRVPLDVDASESEIAVWLTGFAFDTLPSHPNGYTPSAIGIQVGEPRIEAGEVVFEVAARLDAAPVLDRSQKLGSWGSRVRVQHVVVVAPGGQATRKSVSTKLRDGSEFLDPGPPRAPKLVSISGHFDPSLGPAAAGLSGFEYVIGDHGPVAGRYMRAITAGLIDLRSDSAREVWEALVRLRFSNGGGLPRKVNVEASSTITVLQAGPNSKVRKGVWRPPSSGHVHAAHYPSMQPLEGADTLLDQGAPWLDKPNPASGAPR